MGLGALCNLPLSSHQGGWAAASMLECSHGRGMLNAQKLGAGGRGDGGLGEDGPLPQPPVPHLVPDAVQALIPAAPARVRLTVRKRVQDTVPLRFGPGSPNLSWTLTTPGARLGLVAALTRRALPALLAPHCLFIAVSVVVTGCGSGSWI